MCAGDAPSSLVLFPRYRPMLLVMRWPYLVVSVVACGAPVGSGRVTTTTQATPTSRTSTEVRFVAPESTTQVTCPDAAATVDGSLVCADEARAQGLTIVDLGDAWTPRLFATQPDGTAPVFRDTYLALAKDQGPDGEPLAEGQRLAELYGVVPALSIARERIADDERHACHDAIDSSPIALLDRPYAQDHKDVVTAMKFRRLSLEKQLEKERAKRGLPDLEALATVTDAQLATAYAKWKKLAGIHAGILAAQQHLVCEGFLDEKDADGTMTWRTSNAVDLFQRRNFLMPNERLDAETREAMMLDSRELDFRLALRILRERVVDATGLIEDGTASDGPQPILGRMLDPKPMRAARGVEEPLPDGAPDLIGPAVEAAAQDLGWRGPTELRAFFDAHPTGLRVALVLPDLPAYHSAHMDLSAELDRGDVWYDEKPIGRMIRHRPTITLFVNDQGRRRPLVRWPTTIGGWADVTEGGSIVQKWKESDVGPRVWRELYAAPTWLPPKSTPDRELVKNLYNGEWDLKRSIMGPGPHGAYGLVLLVHDNEVTKADGTMSYWDNGIGSHGSAFVTSIVNGTSHGCHRMYNQLAIRLADFLLAHREHIVKGEQKVMYRRTVRHKGTFTAKVDTRGFLYEMTPPVPITVTPGNILSTRKIPPRASAPARPD
ncbi:MAG: Peptidoglycan-binding domain 1 protein [Myxococcales bacterium]|nr:Peptidoglycan-binding domain 1 protein [Myxococcales bacterium]